MAEPQTDPSWTECRLGGVAYAVPHGWAVTDSAPERLAVHVAPGGTGQDTDGHHPVVVATAEPCSVGTAQYSTQILSDMMAHLSLLHILDVALWAPPGMDPALGRRVEFLHSAAGAPLHAVQYLVVRDGTAFSATFTCSERQLPQRDALSWELGDRIRIVGKTLHAAGEGHRPPGLPRLSDYASVRFGAPVEALHVIVPEQPFRSAGPDLPDEAASLLLHLAMTDDAAGQEAAGSGGRIAPGLGTAPLQALVASGLAGADGRLSPQGRTVTAPLRHPAGRATLTAHHGGDQTRLALFHGHEGQTLLLGQRPVSGLRGDAPAAHQPAPGNGPAAALGRTRLDFLPVWLTASAAAAWLALGPAWTTETDTVPVDVRDFDRRVRDRTAPPSGLPTSLALAWEQPWVVWQAEGDGGSATYLDAGESGHHLVESDGAGAVLLTAVPARNVYRHLAALLSPAGAGYGVAPAG